MAVSGNPRLSVHSQSSHDAQIEGDGVPGPCPKENPEACPCIPKGLPPEAHMRIGIACSPLYPNWCRNGLLSGNHWISCGCSPGSRRDGFFTNETQTDRIRSPRLARERTPSARPPRQSKIFEEDRGGLEGEGETFFRKFPLPPPILHITTKTSPATHPSDTGHT